MKLGTMTFTTDGSRLEAFFTDQDGNSTTVLSGESFNDADKAISQMILLMQHRNGIVNFNPDGTISAEDKDPDFRAQLQKIADSDTGIGW